MAVQKNIGVYSSGSPEFEGDWGNVLQGDNEDITLISRGVGGGFYFVYLAGNVTAGDTLNITRKRGTPPKFYSITTDDFTVVDNTITFTVTKQILTNVTLVMREEL